MYDIAIDPRACIGIPGVTVRAFVNDHYFVTNHSKTSKKNTPKTRRDLFYVFIVYYVLFIASLVKSKFLGTCISNSSAAVSSSVGLFPRCQLQWTIGILECYCTEYKTSMHSRNADKLQTTSNSCCIVFMKRMSTINPVLHHLNSRCAHDSPSFFVLFPKLCAKWRFFRICQSWVWGYRVYITSGCALLDLKR